MTEKDETIDMGLLFDELQSIDTETLNQKLTETISKIKRLVKRYDLIDDNYRNDDEKQEIREKIENYHCYLDQLINVLLKRDCYDLLPTYVRKALKFQTAIVSMDWSTYPCGAETTFSLRRSMEGFSISKKSTLETFYPGDDYCMISDAVFKAKIKTIHFEDWKKIYTPVEPRAAFDVFQLIVRLSTGEQYIYKGFESYPYDYQNVIDLLNF